MPRDVVTSASVGQAETPSSAAEPVLLTPDANALFPVSTSCDDNNESVGIKEIYESPMTDVAPRVVPPPMSTQSSLSTRPAGHSDGPLFREDFQVRTQACTQI